MTVRELREVLAKYPDDMRIGLAYDGSQTVEFNPYFCVENEKFEEINVWEATSNDFLVFVDDN